MVIGCLWLSDVSVICRVVDQRRTSQEIWGGFLYGVYSPGNDFELIPTVEMETIRPVEGYFGSEFPTICNHCVVMVAWNRKTLKLFEIFSFFFGKTTCYGKVFKILFLVFIAIPIVVLHVNFVKFGRQKMGEIVRCLPDKKQNFAWLSSCRYCADHVQNLPGPVPTMYSDCFRFHPNRFTFGWVVSERVNTAETRRKVNAIVGWSLASSRIISNDGAKLWL